MENKSPLLKNLFFLLIVTCLILTSTAFISCQPKAPQKIVFGEGRWDTVQLMSRVAGFIVEHGYGYEVEYTAAKNVAIIQAIELGDIDIHMEVAEQSLEEPLQKLWDSGQGESVGISFPGTWQGWLVPTYMIEGDPERGIEPMTPDLKSVFDMPEYWEIFKDPEKPSKGRFYSCIPGWQCEKTNQLKMEAYGLDEYYNIIEPGSDTALSASLVGAYEKGEPWFGYYWSPTWVLAKVDMTPLEEPAFSEDLWTEEAGYACAYPLEENLIVANINLRDKAPDVVAFLGNYGHTIDEINEALLYMFENEIEPADAAIWYLQQYEETWTQWVSSDIADKVKKALAGQS